MRPKARLPLRCNNSQVYVTLGLLWPNNFFFLILISSLFPMGCVCVCVCPSLLPPNLVRAPDWPPRVTIIDNPVIYLKLPSFLRWVPALSLPIYVHGIRKFCPHITRAMEVNERLAKRQALAYTRQDFPRLSRPVFLVSMSSSSSSFSVCRLVFGQVDLISLRLS